MAYNFSSFHYKMRKMVAFLDKEINYFIFKFIKIKLFRLLISLNFNDMNLIMLYFIIFNYFFLFVHLNCNGDWGLGIGDWG